MKFFVNTRYLIVPIMTLLTIYGIFIGGAYSWLGVIFFGINILLDTLTKKIHLRADFDKIGNSYGVKSFQYSVMYLMLPIFIILQAVLALRLYQYTTTTPIENGIFFGFNYQIGLTKFDLIGSTLSAALWAGGSVLFMGTSSLIIRRKVFWCQGY